LQALNERIMNRVNAAGHYFLSHTKLHGKYTIRIAIGNLRTTEQDVRNVWEELKSGLAAELSVKTV
jgi:aromatic-L-amino-acid decarboxylase